MRESMTEIGDLSWPFTCLGNKWRESTSFPIPLLDRLSGLEWTEKLGYLTLKFLQLSQIECPLKHEFQDGNYIREITIPQGSMLIGRPHIHGHQCDLISGTVIHVTEHERRKVDAPFSMHTTPGYQVVIYAMTDVVARTVHPNDGERDIATLEADIFGSIDEMIAVGRRVDSRLRYQRMLTEAGVDESVLRPAIESEEDQVPFPHPCSVEVAPSHIHGNGLHATAKFAAGDVIALARLGNYRTPAGRYTNHDDTPNAVMMRTGCEWRLVACSDIESGAEIFVDYRQVIQLHRAQ